MAKPAIPGRVKTRLIPQLGAQGAAAAHQAMLACVLERVGDIFSASGDELLLAMAWEPGDASRQDLQAGGDAGGPRWRVIDQGQGDLGQRMLRCWLAAGGGPAVFLGVDCPDVPANALRRAAWVLDHADAAVGEVADGGYWTLAARRCQPGLLTGIDWGTSRVYHQTLTAARHARLAVAELPPWYDVDEPADLLDLLRRLRDADEPALLRLRQRLEPLLPKGT